jgi:hypothetical protein
MGSPESVVNFSLRSAAGDLALMSDIEIRENGNQKLETHNSKLGSCQSARERAGPFGYAQGKQAPPLLRPQLWS